MIGQAGDPTSRDRSRDRLDANGDDHDRLDRGGAARERRRRLLAAQGIKYFYHPEQNSFQFFDADRAPGARRTSTASTG